MVVWEAARADKEWDLLATSVECIAETVIQTVTILIYSRMIEIQLIVLTHHHRRMIGEVGAAVAGIVGGIVGEGISPDI